MPSKLTTNDMRAILYLARRGYLKLEYKDV